MSANLNPIFSAILAEWFVAEYIAPEVKIGDRIEVRVAVSRSDPRWIAGTVEHVDMTDPRDTRIDLRADDGRLIPACRADFTRAIVNDAEPT